VDALLPRQAPFVSYRKNDQWRTIWIADAHRDGKRFVLRADQKLTAFMELESAVRLD
jgi:hypothetical protein